MQKTSIIEILSRKSTSGTALAVMFGLDPISGLATPPAHLTIGLEVNENIVDTYLGGVDENQDGDPINDYGGSWNAGTVIVDPGDPDNGILPFNLSRCGSFVTSLLHLAYPQWGGWWGYHFVDSFPGDDSIKQGNDIDWTESPKASEYMDLINQSLGFLGPVEDFRDVCPGDIFVKRDEDGPDGHVAIVVDIDWHNPFPYNGGLFYNMVVLDSSEGYHTDDSREPFLTNGAGIGTVGILVDQNYEPIAQCWSAPEGAENTWAGQLDARLEYESDTLLVFGKLDIPEAMGTCDAVPEPFGEDYLAPPSGDGELDVLSGIQNLVPGDLFITKDTVGTFLGLNWDAAVAYPSNSRYGNSEYAGTVLVPWVALVEGHRQTSVRGLHIQSDGVILGHTATWPKSDPRRQPSQWIKEFNETLQSQEQQPIVFVRENR